MDSKEHQEAVFLTSSSKKGHRDSPLSRLSVRFALANLVIPIRQTDEHRSHHSASNANSHQVDEKRWPKPGSHLFGCRGSLLDA